ncbi:hypothetical protein [Nonomuraea rubra]|uniref:hypothetical protein n=1 Tax=Nonomuraea rubra TaxID=46180 RepID=UPI0033CED443
MLDLLRIVALGDRDDTHLPFRPGREFARAENVIRADVVAVVDWLHGDGDGDEPESCDAVAVSWDRDAYLAAAAISDRFAAWTGDGDPVVAAGAAELLAWFPATPPGPSVSGSPRPSLSRSGWAIGSPRPDSRSSPRLAITPMRSTRPRSRCPGIDRCSASPPWRSTGSGCPPSAGLR